MNASKKSTFYYHADASAIGGRLHQPLERIISTNAAVSLAQAGGFSSCRAEQVNVEGLISATAAYVSVSGGEHLDRGYRSVSTATIEGLNVLEVVTADRVVAQISIMHPYGNRPSEVSFFGSQFVNLKVNGCPVDPVIDNRLFGAGRGKFEDNAESHAPSFRELLAIAQAQYTETADERKRLVATLGNRFDLVDPYKDLEEKGSALCSFVQQVSVCDPIEGFGRVIYVPDFGNIFLGELALSYFSAELTMVRIELGCTAQGSVSVASSRSNGRPIP